MGSPPDYGRRKDLVITIFLVFWAIVAVAWWWNNNYNDDNDGARPLTTADTWSAGEIDGYAACRFDGGRIASCVRRIKPNADRGTIEGLHGCTEYAEDSDFVIEDYADLSFYIQDCFDRQEPPPEPVFPEP